MYAVSSPATVRLIKSTSSYSLCAAASASCLLSTFANKPVRSGVTAAPIRAGRATAPTPLNNPTSGPAETSSPKLRIPDVIAPMPLVVSPRVLKPVTSAAKRVISLPKLYDSCPTSCSENLDER